MALRHCWWCGRLAEVDTEAPCSGGMVRDSETSWLCDDDPEACSARFVAQVKSGVPRYRYHDHSRCHLPEPIGGN